jgi:hypothetical protein
MNKTQLKKEEAKKIAEAKKQLRLKKRNDAKRKSRIYKLLRKFVYHKDIKDFLKDSFNIIPKNHFYKMFLLFLNN